MQQRTIFRFFSVLLLLAAVSPAAAALTLQQIAVLVHRSSRASVKTWKAGVDEQLTALGTEVLSVVSDRTNAISQHTEQGFA